MHLRRTHNFLEKICSCSRRRAPQVSEGTYPLRSFRSRGVTLIDTVVGVALMLVVFVGISGVFRLSVDVVTNNKARAGAIALADQRMEYLRSLSYAAVGTVGGVPSGTLAQSESLSLNGVKYTRRTIVVYADDPKDGTGGSDNFPSGSPVTADYKAAKVDVAWTTRYGGTRHVDLVTRISPATSQGEINPCSGSCGPLVINVVNSVNQPVAGASVTITNASASPAINFSTFSAANGTVTLLAAPAVSGYSASASNSGYTSDQTATPFTVVTGGTSQTLRIDAVSSITVVTQTYGSGTPITNVPFTLSGATYGYNSVLGGVGSPTTTISNLKWDTYTMSVASATGYDIASSCMPQPITLAANTATTTTLYLAPHTSNSLAVKVTSNATGALLSGASVQLTKTGYNVTQTTDACGQTFFSGLTAGTYTASVSKSGYTTKNSSPSVSGQTGLSVAL